MSDEETFRVRGRVLTMHECCGEAQVQGDVFLARIFDNEDEFQRLDFTLREVSSGAPWVKVGMLHLFLLHLPSKCASWHPILRTGQSL